MRTGEEQNCGETGTSHIRTSNSPHIHNNDNDNDNYNYNDSNIDHDFKRRITSGH